MFFRALQDPAHELLRVRAARVAPRLHARPKRQIASWIALSASSAQKDATANSTSVAAENMEGEPGVAMEVDEMELEELPDDKVEEEEALRMTHGWSWSRRTSEDRLGKGGCRLLEVARSAEGRREVAEVAEAMCCSASPCF